MDYKATSAAAADAYALRLAALTLATGMHRDPDDTRMTVVPCRWVAAV